MKRISAWLIRLAYWLGLRRPANRIQQWLFDRRRPVSALPIFPNAESAVGYIAVRWDWGADRDRARFRWADWSSEPEVVQARLDANIVEDGDCDDFAAWVCAALPSTSCGPIFRMSCWGSDGGHTVCLFWRGGKLHLVDYGRIVEVDSYRAALEHVRVGCKYNKLTGWVFETPALELVAVWPDVPS